MSQFVVLLVFTLLLGVAQAILDGNRAALKQFPYQVSVRYLQKHRCGGAIISPRSILTAKSCVSYRTKQSIPAHFLNIRAGTINRIAGGVIVEIKSIKAHPDLDIAILELQENLLYSDSIQAIEMLDDEVPDKIDVIISGWGVTKPDDVGMPIYLQYRRVFTYVDEKEDPVLMLYYPRRSHSGSCEGDFGSPVTYNGKLAAIITFIWGTCGSALGEGSVKASYNIEWIRKNMA